MFLSKAISPSLFAVAYQQECEEKKKLKSKGKVDSESLALLWAKKVCTMLLADSHVCTRRVLRELRAERWGR
jgi:hypothetical protein